MNNKEALEVLAGQLKRYRQWSYTDLLALLDTPQTIELEGPSGVRYQVEIEVFWDDRSECQNICLMAAVDDGGCRAFAPLSNSFIMSPTGAFLGE
jgi:hypothetical protein